MAHGFEEGDGEAFVERGHDEKGGVGQKRVYAPVADRSGHHYAFLGGKPLQRLGVGCRVVGSSGHYDPQAGLTQSRSGLNERMEPFFRHKTSDRCNVSARLDPERCEPLTVGGVGRRRIDAVGYGEYAAARSAAGAQRFGDGG